MIQIKGLTKKYKKGELVFKNFNYEIGRGLNLLIGPNGSGKTTLLNCIADYIQYDGIIDVKDKISYLAEIRKFDSDVVVKDLLKLLMNVYNTDVSGYMKKLNFNGNENKKIAELSKGNETKLYILCALAKPADIYIFDEPTDGLDIASKEEMVKFCKDLAERFTVIVSTHELGVIDRLSGFSNIIDLSKVKKCCEN